MVNAWLATSPGAGLWQSATLLDVVMSDRTYYVATTGDDDNDGLSAATPWLTIQRAVDFVASTLHIGSGVEVTIQVAAGTYGAVTLLRVSGPGTPVLQGDTTTPGNVVISVTNASCINGKQSGRWAVRGFSLTAATSGFGLNAVGFSTIVFRDIAFGAAASCHIRSQRGSLIEADGDYSITGNSPSHWQTLIKGMIAVVNRTVTITGTPTFSLAFAFTEDGSMSVAGDTFSGSATGRRYRATVNGVISTSGGGATYLPGNVAGGTATGGRYI